VRIIRPYVDADLSACCDVIRLAFEDEDGMNDAARAFARSMNVPSAIHRELGAAYTLGAEEQHRVCGVGCLKLIQSRGST
jgi:hypothetical protein